MHRLALVVMIAGVLVHGASPDLRPEIARVRKGAAIVPESERTFMAGRLDSAEVAAARGRTLAALYYLETPWVMQDAFVFVTSVSSITTAEAFQRKWSEMGAPPDPAVGSQRSQVVLEAMALSAEARGPATYRASLPFSEDAGLPAGLYYLGESRAFGHFAAFCRSLGWKPQGPAPPFRSIEPELARLDQTVVAAYERADTEHRRPFIGVNVTIKHARTLDGQRLYQASLLQYLLARYRFAALTPSTTDAASLKRRLSDVHLPAGIDHSIAALFLDLAQFELEAGSEGPARATAILDDVLPAYWQVVP